MVEGTYIDLRVLIDDLEESVHGLVDGVAREHLLLAKQLAHGIFGTHALREVTDLGKHVVKTADTIELHVAVQRRSTKVVLEAGGRVGLLATVDPLEGVVGGLLELLNERAKLDLEVLGAAVGTVEAKELHDEKSVEKG
jgi:hypothetical protein